MIKVEALKTIKVGDKVKLQYSDFPFKGLDREFVDNTFLSDKVKVIHIARKEACLLYLVRLKEKHKCARLHSGASANLPYDGENEGRCWWVDREAILV